MKQQAQILGTHPKQGSTDVEPCFLPLLALFGLFGNRNKFSKFGGNYGNPQNTNPWQQPFSSQWPGANWPMQGMGMGGMGMGMNPFFGGMMGNRMNPPTGFGGPRSAGMGKSWPFMF